VIGGLIFALLLQAQADTPLPNGGEEARAQSLMREIRCVVCENEPVSQSMADIAIDMRRTIRNQIQQGKSDDEVRGFFRERYGNYVLFRPPIDGAGILLWVFPFLLLLGAGGAIAFRMFRHRHRDLTPLPDDRSGDPAP